MRISLEEKLERRYLEKNAVFPGSVRHDEG